MSQGTGSLKCGLRRTLAVITLGLGSLAACSGEDGTSGVTPQGLQVRLSPELLASQAVEVSAGARVISDAAGDRFIVALSGAEQSYVFGRTLSCGDATPVRAGAYIACAGRNAAADKVAPDVGHVYIPLAQAASGLPDADIAAAAPVVLTSITGHGTVSCGKPAEDMGQVMARLAKDMAGEISAAGTPAVPVLASYKGSWARVSVPTSVALAGKSVSEQRLTKEFNVPPDDGGGFSCSCLSEGSCPKVSEWPSTYCDARSCQSCQMSF